MTSFENRLKDSLTAEDEAFRKNLEGGKPVRPVRRDPFRADNILDRLCLRA